MPLCANRQSWEQAQPQSLVLQFVPSDGVPIWQNSKFVPRGWRLHIDLHYELHSLNEGGYRHRMPVVDPADQPSAALSEQETLFGFPLFAGHFPRLKPAGEDASQSGIKQKNRSVHSGKALGTAIERLDTFARCQFH
jgi:hypothetical protein